MKLKVFAYSLLMLILLLSFSCNKKRQGAFSGYNDSIVIVEELPDIKDYSVYGFSNKSDVEADAGRELDSIDSRIALLRSFIESKEELDSFELDNYKTGLELLEQERLHYHQRIEALKESTPRNWDSIKTDLSNAYNTIRQSIDNVLDDRVLASDTIRQETEPVSEDSLKVQIEF